ncbi:MAG TPA: hypothetical protein VKU40_14950 [Thermoanaerobaculia bacterium]|nr:hypothetical protein [Thermoanaerobaculia bacterium]
MVDEGGWGGGGGFARRGALLGGYFPGLGLAADDEPECRGESESAGRAGA